MLQPFSTKSATSFGAITLLESTPMPYTSWPFPVVFAPFVKRWSITPGCPFSAVERSELGSSTMSRIVFTRLFLVSHLAASIGLFATRCRSSSQIGARGASLIWNAFSQASKWMKCCLRRTTMLRVGTSPPWFKYCLSSSTKRLCVKSHPLTLYRVFDPAFI